MLTALCRPRATLYMTVVCSDWPLIQKESTKLKTGLKGQVLVNVKQLQLSVGVSVAKNVKIETSFAFCLQYLTCL